MMAAEKTSAELNDEWRALFAARKAAGWPLWVTAHGRRGRVVRVTLSGVKVRINGVDEVVHPADVELA